MIIDTFERALSYDLGPLWERIFPEFLALYAKGESLALGRYELGDGVFINVEEYAPKENEINYQNQ
ncbi:MAG: YhcH/YjgK/YiaL family protein [Mailhella sp.]|nr:YhcH/YjgK/YiaL family protein [Mailhella sp.]